MITGGMVLPGTCRYGGDNRRVKMRQFKAYGHDVEVGQSDDVWYAEIDEGQIELFQTEHDAVFRALDWCEANQEVCPRCGAHEQATHHPLCSYPSGQPTGLPDETIRRRIADNDAPF